MTRQLFARQSAWPSGCLVVLVLFGLYLSSYFSFLLFHSLAEMFSIVVACSIFTLAWNSRRWLDNHYLLLLGIASLFFGFLDLIHTLAYKGMGVFSGYDANLPTQLWIAARYVQSISLLIAPRYLDRKVRPDLAVLAYVVVIAILLASIFWWGLFPDCFIEGAGLTPFKRVSEYVISLILVASLGLLVRHRDRFDRDVLLWLSLSIALTVGAELAFTFYVDVYGLSNLLGHMFKLLSFYLLYKAIVQTGLLKPHELLFRNLAGSEAALREARDGLEERVEERTTELARANAHLKHEITERKHAEERLLQQVSRLHLLNQITRAISQRLDVQSIVRIAIGFLEEHLPADYGCAWQYDPQAAGLRVLVSSTRSQVIVQRLGLQEGAVVPIAGTSLEEILGGGSVYIPDTAESAVPLLQKFAEAGLRSLAAAPLVAESAAAGVVAVARRDPNSFTSVDCEFLRMLGEQLGLAIHQAQLYTQLEQAYTDLRQTQQAILQQERLRALGQMASGIAHDINNAISPAALYLETLLEDEATLNPQARERLATIQRALEDVAQTIERLRDFYRPRQPQEALIPVDLTALVRQVVDLTRPRWRDQPQERGAVIAVQTDLQKDLPLVPGLVSELRDALTNLVFNAVDAMPEGGTLTIRTFQEAEGRMQKAEGGGTAGSRQKAEGGEPETEDVPLLPTASCQLPSVVIEVADTGVGMDAETRLRCLEPFFTTKGERGTGLGLAMVYGTLQRHGGEIEIGSAPGEGTTVRLRLPVGKTEAAEGGRITAGARPTRPLRLLVVDDDPLLRQSLQDTLAADGHTVTVAAGGQEGIEAVRAAQARGEAFDVVLTDLGMPHVDGRAVARAVKEAAPATPVLLLTGWGVRLNANGEIPPQVDRILGKPPKLRDLRAALADLTGKEG